MVQLLVYDRRMTRECHCCSEGVNREMVSFFLLCRLIEYLDKIHLRLLKVLSVPFPVHSM